MPKTVISTENAPEAMGPYSQAVRSGQLIFCAGQLGVDPATGDLVSESVKEQTRRILQNIQSVLEEAGTTLESIVKTTAFLIDMGDFAEFNEAYAGFFETGPPARSTVGVASLPRQGARVEVECIAVA